MTDVELRLIATALRLRHFTSDELAVNSGVNHNSTRSWLRRNPQLVEQPPAPPRHAAGRGRPRALWQLRADKVSELRALLERAYPLDSPVPSFNLGAAGYLQDLNVIEEYVDTWRAAAKRSLTDVAEMNCAAAQSRIGAAWVSFADLDASGHSVSQTAIEQLVVFEKELGIAEPPHFESLQQVAAWTAQRIKRMMDAGASGAFAARVLSARASARSLPWQARLLLASFAAPVWADEDVPEMSNLSVDDAERCILVADSVPVVRRLVILEKVLQDPASVAVKWTPDQKQAALLGLANRQYEKPVREVQRWLWELPALHACWVEELAPAVWLGIGESRLNGARVLRDLRPSVRNAIAITRGWTGLKLGRLRSDTLDWCERSLEQPDRPERLTGSDLSPITNYFLGRVHTHARVAT